MGLRMPELIMILLIVLLLFGANKIPQLMKGFGQGIKEFKKGMKDDEAAPKEGPKAESPTVETKEGARSGDNGKH